MLTLEEPLLNMKSIIEGERALCFWLSQQTEVSLNHPDEKTRQEASDYVSLMTPVVKSLFTDLAMEISQVMLCKYMVDTDTLKIKE